ncbi:cAMP-dependent protein kinase regulatory subunit [Coprinopsis cinerea okayama7|uniref:cAMP-dependent protein kinase regulatory subunit n=1 Tax=Coprinopsis cinerea (strain Okayama-7 / 130 / ATCC MYA-4618 / FGSC 9003) TaxID=240176 RepID=A8NXY5_COPC7|nr:cAMP-dependent protein kinase regulatory subunit [Coprinopsis cinerea okayama7\|eukprot:XP_001837304.1 cAMP-dependent protein kinase regulatory subunit [Coprinopsis cinerea okayama7\
MSSTFDSLVGDLTRDYQRAQPRDALQFCANWFQTRLEEQRTRTRDLLSQRSSSLSVPADLYIDTPANGSPSNLPFPSASPLARPRSSFRDSIAHSPFGTLNVPGNALLSGDRTPPTLKFNQNELPPTSPLTTVNPFASFDTATPTGFNNDDYLVAPTSAIFARRTSVSAESIAVDSGTDEVLPVYPKGIEQLRRIKAAIRNNFIFRDLDEEQEKGVLDAMQERQVVKNEVVIRQGDVGEYFYVVEAGQLNCYIRTEPLPPNWLSQPNILTDTGEKFIQPKHHPELGRLVQECKAGSSFGELALMYGHPRAASVLAIEPSTLWALDRITFRTIILKAAHRRRTMYERFLSTVPLLSSLDAAERSKIADALNSSVYKDGEAVVKQGELGDTFFFVEEGEAIATKHQQLENGETREIKVGHLKKGDYFGELSLLRAAPRAATVSAVHRTDPSQPKLKVAALDEAAFTRLLGPLRELMERKAGEAYGRLPLQH